MEVVRALDSARRLMPEEAVLQDVPGGWDVTLGNVVLDSDGVPACTAHGALIVKSGVYVCTECEARALLVGPTP
jgi:hypothetical protein